MKTLVSKSQIEGLPRLFWDKGFGNFQGKNPLLQSSKDFCIRFYKGETEKKSLVLCGSVGSGKTHLAISVLKNLPEVEGKYTMRKQIALFMVADEFFMTLNDASQTRESKLSLIRKWLLSDMVCLDDLGTYNMTPAKMENLYTFINHAYLEERRIIITTNFTLKDFDQYDKRIGSRLQEMAHIIAFSHEDYRKIK